jgi:hypothetical protein
MGASAAPTLLGVSNNIPAHGALAQRFDFLLNLKDK